MEASVLFGDQIYQNQFKGLLGNYNNLSQEQQRVWFNLDRVEVDLVEWIAFCEPHDRNCLTNCCTDAGVQSRISIVSVLTGKAKKEYLCPLIF
jgi:hypothetical protein